MDGEERQKHRPTVLIVLDGWGVAVPSQANGITQAKTPFFDSLVSRYPTATLQASGEATGLPWGEVGNSEVGHMSIGAGRIVFQELTRINAAISSKEFFLNPVFLEAIAHTQKTGGTLHLMGLTSSGGVHSHSDHLMALVELAKEKKVPKIRIHAILDGRDTSYASGKDIVEQLMALLPSESACIASISGRFYAMDRDHHWDRIEKAYRVLVAGDGCAKATDVLAAIDASYQQSIFDEEFAPIAITDAAGIPVGALGDGDAVIFFNIRADRARQLTQCFLQPGFDKFPRREFKNLFFVTLTEYEKILEASVAFPPQLIEHSLAQVISEGGLTQLHVAETEKYAHITYFLNDGREEPYPGEKRVMIPSPSVESYDKKPEMSARAIAETVVKAVEQDEYDFIAVNFANADMVGHTGNMRATIKAVEVLDECLKTIVVPTLAHNGALLITADHGNAESLIDLTSGTIDKEHSNNPVPCIIIVPEREGSSLGKLDVTSQDLSILAPSGMLSDVAPTLLSFMGIPKPAEMTGNNLLES